MSSLILTFSGLILAGGEGRRMGGVDKGLQLFKGKPLTNYVLDVSAPFVTTQIISANRNIDQYQLLSGLVISDLPEAKAIGPLGGLLAAASVIKTSHVLVLPCDTPHITASALNALIEAAKIHPNLIHYLKSESGPHPLHAVIPVAVLRDSLPSYLSRAEHLGVMAFYRTFGCEEVIWYNDAELDNFNFAEQLQ